MKWSVDKIQNFLTSLSLHFLLAGSERAIDPWTEMFLFSEIRSHANSSIWFQTAEQ